MSPNKKWITFCGIVEWLAFFLLLVTRRAFLWTNLKRNLLIEIIVFNYRLHCSTTKNKVNERNWESVYS